MKELHRKAAAIITPLNRRHENDGGRCPSTFASHTNYTSWWQNLNESTCPAANTVYGSHPHVCLILQSVEGRANKHCTPSTTAAPAKGTILHTKTVREKREQESWCRCFFSPSLTWKDDVGWMLTLACFQWSPWLPFRDQTGTSELVWPFCLRKAFSVPAHRKERSRHM